MKKYNTLFLLVLMLFGCSHFLPKNQADIPTPQEQSCSELKNNIIFNNPVNSSIDNSTATQQAQMIRQYKKHDCDKL